MAGTAASGSARAGRRPGAAARFLIPGSASPEVSRQSLESLAWRVEFADLHGFDLRETGADRTRNLWIRGGFPGSYLPNSEVDSVAWREGFVRTFLKRDLPQFGIRVEAPVMRRFWTMPAHGHGQVEVPSIWWTGRGQSLLMTVTFSGFESRLKASVAVKINLERFG